MSETTNLTQTGTTLYQKQTEELKCPVCGQPVDYLLGEDVNGGRMGCELCWRPPLVPQTLPMQPGTSVERPINTPLATPPPPPPVADPLHTQIPNTSGLDLNPIDPKAQSPDFENLVGKLRQEVKTDDRANKS